MRKLFTTLLFTGLICTYAIGQITIEAGDISNIYDVGNKSILNSNIGIFTVDIGSPGGDNNWDFSGLIGSTEISLESVDVGSSPYADDFGGADICIKRNCN